MNERNLAQYIDHQVVDRNGDKIGKLTCLWSDGGEPAYLGVQTGWLFGKTHVVPADAAEVNPNSRTIRLPYTTEQVKDAPCYDPGVELGPDTERDIRSYYRSGTQPAAPASGQGQGRGQEAANIKLHEEQLKVGKRQVEAGGVRLRKIIHTEQVTQPVELQHEEIVVERVPGRETPESGATDFQQQDIFIPLRREEPVVEKEGFVREEVRVSKKPQTERQKVSGQVRKEDVDVQRTEEQKRLDKAA